MLRLVLLLVLPALGSLNLLSQPTVVAVVNSASFQSGLPAGGALATVYVSGLTALTTGIYIAPSSQPLPHTLGGVTVTVDNDFAPLLAVIVPSDASGYVQVNLQVPLSANASLLSGSAYAGNLIVTDGVNNAVRNETGNVPQWGGFFSGANGYAIARHASDSTLVTPQNPAHRGGSIIAYADDFFLTWPRPPIAIPTPPQVPYQPDYSLRASPGNLYLQTYPNPVITCAPIPGLCNGGTPDTPALTINSVSLAVGSVGVEEVNFVIPSNQPAGTFALFFNGCANSGAIPGGCGGISGDSSPYVMLPVN